MGLTKQSTGRAALSEVFNLRLGSTDDIVVALAGNPNTGKSTVFNSLTGLKQHTGNWPGKTITNAQGTYSYQNKSYILVDLPGTYSLLASSVEEELARDFICFGNPDATVVVADATCLERNLNLVLQITEITSRVILCVNLMDEARRKNISLKLDRLSDLLGIPVVATAARSGQGLDELKTTIAKVASGKVRPKPVKITYDNDLEALISELEPLIQPIGGHELNSSWLALRLLEGDESLLRSIKDQLAYNLAEDEKLQEGLARARARLDENKGLGDLRDRIVTSLVKTAESISKRVITSSEKASYVDRKIDRILTSKTFGIPIMIGLLGLIFWITIEGANIPSELLAKGLFFIEERLLYIFDQLASPVWLKDMLVLGVYRTLAWVVSVMLPPMAIFFPLFTLLEDLGYLPRVAFMLDYYFKRACAHGKQALTMCMGFGCNAAGVVACRIIDSPRERLIATITNNFVPCNGRFPILIAMASIFIGGSLASGLGSLLPSLAVLASIILGVIITLFVSKLLSKTILKGLPSSFTLELPPYRRPQVGRVLVRSLLDRTLFVLARAIMVAAPAGLIIWLMANVKAGGISLLDHGAGFLDPFARLLGMDGYIILAFILGLPANEIVIPIIIMSYMATGNILELDSLDALRELLVAKGWTWLTAICTMIFTLNHWPCGTTLFTIRKETQSLKWTLLSFAIPTITGIIICFLVASGARLLGLV